MSTSLPGDLPCSSMAVSHLLEVASSIVTREAGGSTAAPAFESRVPIIRSAAPVRAGNSARAVMRVANDDASPAYAALYFTNLASDSGHEIPSLRIKASPRNVSIPANGEVAFDIEISISEQTRRGTYSGLVQVTGSKYVKAVLSVEVL